MEVKCLIITGRKAQLSCHTKQGKRALEIDSPKGNTKNQEALIKLTEALKHMNRPSVITICTDSAYLYGAIANRWVDQWKKGDWIKANGKKVANKELWEEYCRVVAGHAIRIERKKG